MGLNKAIEAILADKAKEAKREFPEDEIGQALKIWGFEFLQQNTFRMTTPRMVYTIAKLNKGGYKLIAKSTDKELRLLVTGIKERRQLELILNI